MRISDSGTRRCPFVVRGLEKGMEETMHHRLHNARLDLAVMGIKSHMACGTHDMEGDVEVEGAMKKTKVGR